MFDQDRISPLSPYNIKQKSNWNNEKYLLGDYSGILNIGGKFLRNCGTVLVGEYIALTKG